MPSTSIGQHERQLLREVGEISDRVRALRTANAALHSSQIKTLEAEAQVKWRELRAQRAGPFDGDVVAQSRRSSRW